jgi:hypothetical protein
MLQPAARSVAVERSVANKAALKTTAGSNHLSKNKLPKRSMLLALTFFDAGTVLANFLITKASRSIFNSFRNQKI